MMKTLKPDDDFTKNYKILIGSVLPRPIAFVSTLNLDNSHNVAPFSFFNAVSAKPMILAFCPLIRTSTLQKKDTVINIERTKEFVINIPTYKMIEKVNEASGEFPYGVDEFKKTGLTPVSSVEIKPMRVKECPIQFECKLREHLNYGNGPGAGNLITGEVVAIHIQENLLDEGRISTKKLEPVGRCAGTQYIKVTDTFELTRKMKAQIQ